MTSERQVRKECTLGKELHDIAFPSVYSMHQSHAHSPYVPLTLSASVSLLLGTISKFGLKEGIKRCSDHKLKSLKDHLHI